MSHGVKKDYPEIGGGKVYEGKDAPGSPYQPMPWASWLMSSRNMGLTPGTAQCIITKKSALEVHSH